MGSLTRNVDKARPKPKLKCSWGAWMEQLDDEDIVTMTEIMADPAWTAADVHSFLREEGLPFGLNIVRRHRNGSCSECVG